MCELGSQNPSSTEALYSQIARELRAVGVNINFAPVADLCEPNTAGAIGDRSFGSDPETVGAHVASAVRGLQRERILACVKHFPGHGATTQDSHRETPVVKLSGEEMEQRELVPFRFAIETGVKSVMTAHALYPFAGDAERPASLSKYWLTEVLRHKMNFQGLTITDAIEMQALLCDRSPRDCGYHAINAGADIVVYYKEAYQFEAFFELRRALERGDLDRQSIAERLRRIRDAKKELQSQSKLVR
jgi:beta-N-acetylhexosaminidase